MAPAPDAPLGSPPRALPMLPPLQLRGKRSGLGRSPSEEILSALNASGSAAPQKPAAAATPPQLPAIRTAVPVPAADAELPPAAAPVVEAAASEYTMCSTPPAFRGDPPPEAAAPALASAPASYAWQSYAAPPLPPAAQPFPAAAAAAPAEPPAWAVLGPEDVEGDEAAAGTAFGGGFGGLDGDDASALGTPPSSGGGRSEGGRALGSAAFGSVAMLGSGGPSRSMSLSLSQQPSGSLSALSAQVSQALPAALPFLPQDLPATGAAPAAAKVPPPWVPPPAAAAAAGEGEGYGDFSPCAPPQAPTSYRVLDAPLFGAGGRWPLRGQLPGVPAGLVCSHKRHDNIFSPNPK